LLAGCGPAGSAFAFYVFSQRAHGRLSDDDALAAIKGRFGRIQTPENIGPSQFLILP
jgi:hypothetical protein